MKSNKKNWTRLCPNCDNIILYTSKYSKIRADAKGTNCFSCNNSGKNNPMYGKKRSFSEDSINKIKNSLTGIKRSEKTKEKMRNLKLGNKNSMFGKNVYNMWVDKYGKEEAERRKKQKSIKCSEANKGIVRSEETRKKMRLIAIKRLEDTYGQLIPNYNPYAIPIIEQKAKEFGIDDLQHAETSGGEFKFRGYYADGYSEEKNIWIEYYEDKHKYKKERDEQRKKEIIKHLGCEFIEIREKNV